MATLEERLQEVEALNAQDFINPSPEPEPQMAQPGPVRQVEGPIPGTQMQVQPQGPTLESRLSEVTEALQQDGRPVQADLGSKEHNAVLNYLGAFNNKVAEAVAAPPELINEVLSLIGAGAFKPGDMREANREAFRR